MLRTLSAVQWREAALEPEPAAEHRERFGAVREVLLPAAGSAPSGAFTEISRLLGNCDCSHAAFAEKRVKTAGSDRSYTCTAVPLSPRGGAGVGGGLSTDLAGPGRRGSWPSACTAGPGVGVGPPAAGPAKSFGRTELGRRGERERGRRVNHTVTSALT